MGQQQEHQVKRPGYLVEVVRTGRLGEVDRPSHLQPRPNWYGEMAEEMRKIHHIWHNKCTC